MNIPILVAIVWPACGIWSLGVFIADSNRMIGPCNKPLGYIVAGILVLGGWCSLGAALLNAPRLMFKPEWRFKT